MQLTIVLIAKLESKYSAASCGLTCVWPHNGAKYLCAFGKAHKETAEPQEVLAIRDLRFVVPIERKLNKSKSLFWVDSSLTLNRFRSEINDGFHVFILESDTRTTT